MTGSAGALGESRIKQDSAVVWQAPQTDKNRAKSEVPTALSDEIVMTYRGWHSFEKANGGPSIVDFDLSDLEGEREFESRFEVFQKLEELQTLLSGQKSNEFEFLDARLRGSMAYILTLMGDQIPFSTYIKQTLGIDPEPFSPNLVSEARQKLESLLDSIGLELNPASRATYERKFLLNPNEIKREILSQKDLWLSRLKETGVPVPTQLPLTVKFAEVDAYWSNWIEGSYRNGLKLTINLHKRNRYDKGRALFLCLHEICGHAVQMSIWRERIAAEEISQACGITTVHSPEAFIAEGLGQTVPDLLSRYEFSNEFEIGRALRYYTLVVLHNAHLQLYAGRPLREILMDLSRELPLSQPQELQAQMKDRGTSPLYRTYLLSYAAGETKIRELIEAAPSEKKNLFSAIYTRPMTPQQLIASAKMHYN